ncbi:MAG: hypothetical protein ABSG79_12595 [Bryobacteraceae bacterium]
MRSSTKMFVCLSMAAVLLVPGWAADPATSPASPAPAAATPADIAKLKAQLDQQQKQIEQLMAALAAQRKMLEQAGMATPVADQVEQHATPPDRLIASTTPMALPVATPPPPSPAPLAGPPEAQAQAAAQAPAEESSPLQLRIGNATIMPVGFMDFTTFWRDKDAASSMGSNFGSVPYNNTVQGNLSEFHFSNQNSRLGFRIDGNWKGAHFIGYNEFDFNGTSGSTSLAVSNGAIVPRLRLYWVDVRKGAIEFLAGQSWSMLVPNRKGLSALPSDLFYSQVIDINYIAGLTWTRQPGLRVLFHGPQDKVNFGLSVEQADQYIGGSGGGGAITLPSALSGLVPTQVDSAGNISGAAYLQSPTLTPDFIAKAAFDPSSRFHFEVGGILSSFKTSTLAAPWSGHTTTGEGLTFGLNAGVTNNVRFVASGLLSDGEGRYLFGAAPDIIVRADGSLSPLRADGWISGLEGTFKNTLLYAYYSGDYIGRNVAFDANGTSLIGYGYRGAANSQNRSIQEITFGFNQTIWKDAKYGAINLMGQYEYLMRLPWYVALNAPKGTHDNTIYFNVRYTLPGSAPTIK